MRLALALAAALAFAATASAVDAPLQELSRFLAGNYCVGGAAVIREISFTAPLSGAETTFLHFAWKVTVSDQYGRTKSDELFGVVKYCPSGKLEQLVIGGPLVHDKRLRDLRQAIRAARGWPKRDQGAAFGPGARADEVGRVTAAAVNELLGIAVQVKEVRFHPLNSIAEPDGTWHVDLRAVESEVAIVVKARVEPFSGSVIQVDVCRGDGC